MTEPNRNPPVAQPCACSWPQAGPCPGGSSKQTRSLSRSYQARHNQAPGKSPAMQPNNCLGGRSWSTHW